MVVHPIDPVYDKNSKILILGSFPSVKSREEGFFYGHKQNRFWKVISAVFNEEEPKSIEEKKALLLRNHIALWDVIKSCDIVGSSDSSISNVVANDLSVILDMADISVHESSESVPADRADASLTASLYTIYYKVNIFYRQEHSTGLSFRKEL